MIDYHALYSLSKEFLAPKPEEPSKPAEPEPLEEGKGVKAYLKEIPRQEKAHDTALEYDPYTKLVSGRIHGTPLEKPIAPKALYGDLLKRQMPARAAGKLVQKLVEPHENKDQIQQHLNHAQKFKLAAKNLANGITKKKAGKPSAAEKAKRAMRQEKYNLRAKFHMDSARKLGYDAYIWKEMNKE